MSYRLHTGKPKAERMLVMIPLMFGTGMALDVITRGAAQHAHTQSIVRKSL